MRSLADYLIPAGALAAPLASSAVLTQSLSGNPVEGGNFAREICATCHEVEKGQYGISPEGAPPFQGVADNPAMTSLALRVFIRSPLEVMPNLMLSESETDDVIAYILSLK